MTAAPDLHTALAQRHGNRMLVIGVVLIVAAIPGLLPAWLQELDDGALDWLLVAWGAGEIAMALIARRWRHRGMFLVDAIFQTALTTWWTFDILGGRRSIYWLPLVALTVFTVVVAIRQFRRFRAP